MIRNSTIENKVTVDSGITVTSLDPKQKSVTTSTGRQYRYQKLLLATGGVPRTLPIPGGDLEGICYFRTLDDYLKITNRIHSEGKKAVVIGGGFIGSEIAAALAMNKIDVTMIFPDSYLVNRVFPEYLGRALLEPVPFARDKGPGQ